MDFFRIVGSRRAGHFGAGICSLANFLCRLLLALSFLFFLWNLRQGLERRILGDVWVFECESCVTKPSGIIIF